MQEERYSFYELDPRYFKDNSGNGIGDLAGLASKFDYFQFLGVDAIILKNITAIESLKPGESHFMQVASEIGTANDLIRVISKAKALGKKILMDIPIGHINQDHNWFQAAANEKVQEFAEVVNFKSQKGTDNQDYGFSKSNQKYFLENKKTKEIPLNWSSNKVIKHFLKVIRYWADLGVNGFVFKDFEFLSDDQKQNLMSEATLKELRKFYRGIKEINDQLIIVGRSLKLPLKTIRHYTAGPTKVFDYFLPENIAENGVHPKFGHDLIGKFSAKKLAKDIKILANDPANILTFNTAHLGKAVSRWTNDGQYLPESAKALAMLAHLTGASANIYQGDELGATNIGLTHLDDFQDPFLQERKKYLISRKVTEKDFLEAQVLQGAINARALMAWDDSKDGGFSIAEKTVTPPSINHKEVNVKNQYNQKTSVLSFYKTLLTLMKRPSYAKIIAHGSTSISSLVPGVVKYILKDAQKQRELLLLVNLTPKNKPIKRLKTGQVILSSYAQKKYPELPKVLEAYEAILVSQQAEDPYLETQAIKTAELNESKRIAQLKVAEAKEQAKQKALSLQKRAQADQEAKAAKEREILAAQESQARAIEAQIEAAKKAEAAAAALAAQKAQTLKAQPTNVDSRPNEDLVEAKAKPENLAQFESEMYQAATQEIRALAKDLDKSQDPFAEKGVDISLREENALIKDINHADQAEFQQPEVIAEDQDHELKMEDATSGEVALAKAKEVAQANRNYDRSYQDEQTKLKEEELAKTILVDDNFDIDELFKEDK